jgi:hypothetical protein
MGTLVGGFLMLFGAVWTAIILTVSRSMGSGPAAAAAGNMLHMMTWLGVGFFAVGAILLVGGLIGAGKTRKKALAIFEKGVAAKGTVTFVDKNYGILVNNTPIYSIVEFTFQDARGITITSRKPNVSSDLVIRNRIEVGGHVAIKYLPDDPEQNILLLADPSAMQPPG